MTKVIDDSKPGLDIFASSRLIAEMYEISNSSNVHIKKAESVHRALSPIFLEEIQQFQEAVEQIRALTTMQSDLQSNPYYSNLHNTRNKLLLKEKIQQFQKALNPSDDRSFLSEVLRRGERLLQEYEQSNREQKRVNLEIEEIWERILKSEIL